ncbi:class I SAM-dependent methyltransferase [Bradyrhizobium sp. HKCCYLS3077]|uniref:class I SAM-dependent methyltransferase n=1 Tax=unclassified Bradyrhizobium TaxID=2631580 RepID=UPI003EBB3FDC
MVDPYTQAVSAFLCELGSPSVVDVGCGDFHVGSQLVDCAGRYIGCDVVDFVIAQNRRKHPNVEFLVRDAVTDELPPGDVVLIRQVLQHLSNRQVSQILPKLCNYRFAVVTEHIPGFRDFVPNLDKAAGPDHRVNFGSGLVLTEPPFNLKADNIRVLCDVEEFGGRIRTTLYDRPWL